MIYYVGGKFNPWTRGHQKVLDSLCKHIEETKCWNENDQILIGVTELEDNSGVGCHQLCSSEEYRIEMIRASIRDCKNKYSIFKTGTEILFTVQDKPYTYEFLKEYCEKHNRAEEWANNDITLVLGEDEYKMLKASSSLNGGDKSDERSKKWKYADEVLRMKFFVVDRQSAGDAVSSTRVRDILYRNPYTSYNDVRDYLTKPVFDVIKSNCHYWQQGYEDDYRREETNELKKYDITKYPRPSATVDMIVIEKNKSDLDKILLVRRRNFPFKSFWALPGGFLDIDEDLTLEEAASRELMEETEIFYTFKPCHQFRTYSDMGSDPRGRVVDTVYAVKGESWFAHAGDDACELDWFDVNELPRMAFNHRKIIEDYLAGDKYNSEQSEDKKTICDSYVDDVV